MNFHIEFESLSDLLADGLEALLQEDHDELESDGFPLDVDWDAGFSGERAGTFRPIALRVGFELCGYAAFHVQRHFHSRRSLAAFNDCVWVKPEYRARCGAPLIRRSEQLLRGLGVERVWWTAKVAHPALGALLLKLGYAHDENVFKKVIR